MKFLKTTVAEDAITTEEILVVAVAEVSVEIEIHLQDVKVTLLQEKKVVSVLIEIQSRFLLRVLRFGGFAQRLTLPAFRQEVQTLTRLGVTPSIRVRTRWMFGFQRRLVRRCECEML